MRQPMSLLTIATLSLATAAPAQKVSSYAPGTHHYRASTTVDVTQ